MNDLSAYAWISLGVLIAVVFPIISGFVHKQFPPDAAPGMPLWLKRYGGLFLFCLVTALICLAGWKATHHDAGLEWFTAFLLGFGWESTVEKLLKTPLPQ